MLAATVGRTISRVSRVLYVGPDGNVDGDEGPVELAFTNGSSLLIRGGYGWRLICESEPWRDPFAPPLSDDNREFVSKSGKWTAFDVSARSPYRVLVGATVLRASRSEEAEKSTVVSVVTSEGTLVVREEWDETYVHVTD